MKRKHSAGVYVAIFGIIAVALGVLQAKVESGQRPQVGEAAPALTLHRLDGSAWTLAEQRGKVVLLDFWARWCKPCVRQMPALERLHRALGPAGLRLLSVNIEGADAPTVRAWVRKRGLSFPVALDSGAASAIFRVSRIPLLVLIGPGGKVRKVYDAGASESALERDVRSLLGAAGSGPPAHQRGASTSAAAP